MPAHPINPLDVTRFAAMDEEPGAFMTVYQGLRGGVLSWAGQAAVGWALRSVGLETDASMGALEEIARKLDTIQLEIVNLTNQITALGSQLTSAQYGIQEAILNTDTIPFVTTNTQTLQDLMGASTLNRARFDAYVAQLTDANNLGKLAALGLAQLGPQGLQTLLANFLQRRFHTLAKQSALVTQFDKYDRLQLLAANLQQESFHYQSPPDFKSAARTIDTYQSNRKQQSLNLIFTAAANSSVMVDTTTNLMWSNGPFRVYGPDQELGDIYDDVSSGSFASDGFAGFRDWIVPVDAHFDQLTSGLNPPYVANLGAAGVPNLPAGDHVYAILGRDFGTDNPRYEGDEPLYFQVYDLQTRSAQQILGQNHDKIGSAIYCMLLVRNPSQDAHWYEQLQLFPPQSVTLTQDAPTVGAAQYHATATLANGASLDVTQIGQWTTDDDADLHAGNGPDGSTSPGFDTNGRITVQHANYPVGRQVQFTLALPSGTLSASLPFADDLGSDESLASLVVTPSNRLYNTYPQSVELMYSLVRGCGRVDNALALSNQQQGTLQVQSSNPELVVITPGQTHANLPAPGPSTAAQQKIKVTATFTDPNGTITGTAHFVLQRN